jgi:hypothetical protein
MVRFDKDDPSVAFASSRSVTGVEYRIDGADGLFPRCSCPASRWGRECGHVLAVLEAQL